MTESTPNRKFTTPVDDSKDITFNCHVTPDIIDPEFSPSGPDRKPKNDIWVLDTGVGLEHGPGMHDSLHDDSAFLPWHRGYFGVGGTAGPGGSSY